MVGSESGAEMTRGEKLRQRVEAQFETIAEFSALIDEPGQSTLYRAFRDDPKVSQGKWNKYERAIAQVEKERGAPPLPPVEGKVFPSDESKIRRIELSGVYGVDRIYVEDRDDTDPSELERRIAAIIRGVKKGAGEGENDAGSN